VSVAQAHRILFAKKLITETALSMTEIALASGFGSVRRFNDVFHHTYGRTPSDLRKKKRPVSGLDAGIALKLPFAAPYDWAAMISFLGARAIPGVEAVDDEGYRRTFALDGANGTLEVRPVAGESVLLAVIHTSDVKPLGVIVARLRRLFDLDADIAAIDEHLARDQELARRVTATPGLRVPGAWDPFELAVRAVLGQQVSVRAATTFSGRLVAALGKPLGAGRARGGAAVLFPTPAAMAMADLGGLGLTGARAATLKSLAAAVAADPRLLRSHDTLEETVAKLCELPGIGPWTAQYIAMRALREPDAFPAADLGLLRALLTSAGRPTASALSKRAEAWRPWRAYAALRLWSQTI
jgi:AraC family transcriptional regulator of adaptative response / DNA-3-methyladenine glycosylase II